MQSVPEGSQTGVLHLYDFHNFSPVSSGGLSRRPATQTEQLDASSIGGSSMRYLNSTTKRGEDTHVSSSTSWSGHPLSQNESPEVSEREAVTPFRFNLHATPFFPTLPIADEEALFARAAETASARSNPGNCRTQSRIMSESVPLSTRIPTSTLDPA